MRTGIVIDQAGSPADVVAAVEAAERVGVATAWLAQTPTGSEALTVLAAGAVRTRAIALGTAVVPTFPRHPLVTASQLRALVGLAPGRIRLGVSPGHRTWVERAYGLRFERPLRQLGAWVQTVRRLMDGDELKAEDNAFGIAVGAHPDGPSSVPITIAATGPRLLELAGSVADGAMTWMCDPTFVRDVAVPALHRGAGQVGRPVPGLLVGVLVCVTDDAEAARSALGPRLAPLAEYESYRGSLGSAAPVDVALVGDEQAVTEKVVRLAEAGADEVAVVVLPDPADPPASLERGRRLVVELGLPRATP